MKRVAVMIAVAGLGIPLAAFAADRHASKAAMNAAEHRETEAMNRLEAAGYHDFGPLKPAGSAYRVTVAKDGRQVSVLVDPDKGIVTDESTVTTEP
jgi:hypothetical protein